jgi:hypothetical protein
MTAVQEQRRAAKAGRYRRDGEERRIDGGGRLQFLSFVFRRPSFDMRTRERLKSLPLTIILTVVIWMYAESQVSVRSDSILTLTAVPVWVSGPPQVLAQFDVKVEPLTVSVNVSGTPAQIKALRKLTPGQVGIHAYLDVSEDDRPTSVYVFRQVRYAPPPGITITQTPESVGFRLVPKTSPATSPATNENAAK